MAPSIQMDGFDSVYEQWEQILPHCFTNNIFVTPWWQQVWWRHFGGDSELRVISVQDGDAVLGIAPLALRDGRITFLGDTDLFDYHDFLVRKGSEQAFYAALWDHVATMEWDAVELRSIPEGSPTLTYLPRVAEEKGFTVDVQAEDVAPVAMLPSTWDDYLAGLKKKDRHELRRKLRRLDAQQQSGQKECVAPESVPGCMEDFFRLFRASGPDKREFMTPQRERFFLDIARELAERDQLRLSVLEVDGVSVAACINFDYSGSYLLYNSGYDPAYASLSVGLLNKALSIKDAIEHGRKCFCFLRGPERYKYDLGGTDRTISRLVIRR